MKKEICYYTFHSTKGLEYENVAIILAKDFGQDKDLFELYFKNLERMKNKLLINMKKAEIAIDNF